MSEERISVSPDRVVSTDRVVSPPRLVEGDDVLGRLLAKHRALSLESSHRTVAPSFSDLMAELNRRSRTRALGGFLMVAAALGTLTLSHELLTGASFSRFIPVARPPILAESDRPAVNQQPTSQDVLGPMGIGVGDQVQPAARNPEGNDDSRLPPTQQAGIQTFPSLGPKGASSQIAQPSEDSPSAEFLGSTQPPTPSRGLVEDQQLAAGGNLAFDRGCSEFSGLSRTGADTKAIYEQALLCYDRRAQEGGIGAELAYLERARLQQSVGDLAGALTSISQYEAQFPDGTLFPESILARIRVLVQMERGEEARQAIAIALGRLPEKATVLRELAVDLAVAENRCVEALELVTRIPVETATSAWKSVHLRGCRSTDK